MLTFVALPKRDSMAIYNARQVFDVNSVLPSSDREIEIIGWTGKEGFFEYSEGLRITKEFVELAPYAPLIREWLTAAGDSLTLDLAKQVMKDLITALYFSKRQMPYSYLGRQFSAVDDDVLFNVSNATLISEINRAIGQLNAVDNAAMYGFRWSGRSRVETASANANWSPVTDAYPMSDYQVYFGGANEVRLAVGYYSPQAYVPAVGGYTGIARDSAAPWWMPAYTGAVPGVSGPSAMPWETVEPTQFVTLSSAQLVELMQLIATRSQQLLVTKGQKINALMAPTVATIAEVIAFDVTSGW